jgi:hypothetical protein
MRWILTNGLLVVLLLTPGFAREIRSNRTVDQCFGSGGPSDEECVAYDDFLRWQGFSYTPGNAHRVAISGQYAYVLDDRYLGEDAGLRVIDITDPTAPVLTGSLDTLGRPWRIAVSGDLAYVADQELGLQVFDVTDPAAPGLIGAQDPPSGAFGVAVSGNFAFVATTARSLDVLDVTDPSAPRLVASKSMPGYTLDVSISGDHAYVTNWDYWWGELQIVDVTDPLLPITVGTASTDGPMVTVALSDQRAYVGLDGPNRLQVIDVADPTSPVLRGWLDTPFSPEQIAVHGDHAYVTVGDGALVVDVVDPDSPRMLGTRERHNWRWTEGVAVSEDRLVIANQVAATVYELGSGDVASIAGSLEIGEPDFPRGIVLSGRYAYVAAGRGGLHVIDLDAPTAPVLVASVSIPTYARSVAVSGDHVYVTASSDGLQIVDVADPLTPAIVNSVKIPDSARSVVIAENYAYVTAYNDGLHIVDIADPMAAAIVGSVQTPASARAVAVSGNHAYVGDYSGLQVIDVSDRTAPVIVGSLESDQNSTDIAVSGKRAYMVSDSGLEVVNVSDPTDPVLEQWLITPGSAESVAISGRFAYVTDGLEGLQVIDVAVPSSAYLSGSVGMVGRGQGVAVSDQYVYVTASSERFREDVGGLRVARLACEPPIEVSIDVKPGSDPNSVNCRNRRGVIPVAILSTDDLDATFIDPATVHFGPGEAPAAHHSRHGVARHEEDVDGDGATDLVLHFRLAETGIECGDDRVELTGETYDGRRVVGSDAIRAGIERFDRLAENRAGAWLLGQHRVPRCRRSGQQIAGSNRAVTRVHPAEHDSRYCNGHAGRHADLCRINLATSRIRGDDSEHRRILRLPREPHDPGSFGVDHEHITRFNGFRDGNQARRIGRTNHDSP